MDAAPDMHDLSGRFYALRQTVQGKHFSRPMLRSYFDTWVRQRDIADDCPNFLYGVASIRDRLDANAADPADDASAVAMALVALGADEHILSFVAAAVAAGLFDAADATPEDLRTARAKFMADLTGCLSEGTAQKIIPQSDVQFGAAVGLEAHDDDTVWVDPGRILPALIKGRRRLCRIEYRNQQNRTKSIGTGFLIGPSAVLTNRHVVDEVKERAAAPGSWVCAFDYSDTTGLKNTQSAMHKIAEGGTDESELDVIASSPVGLQAPENPPSLWWNDDAIRKQFQSDVATDLDYAVLRLETSPGLQRGWYDLQKLPQAFSALGIALHHPGQQDQTISVGSLRHSFDGGPRLFHEAATSGGSSGGCLIDQDGRAIGLHQGGIPFKENNKKRFINIAISLRHIAEDLKAKGAFDQIERAQDLAPPIGCVDGIRPLFGRTDLLRKLQQMLDDPQKRILTVRYSPKDGEEIEKPGKSYTADIIRGLFREPEHKHIMFRAGETETHALQFVSETMGQFASDLVSTLPAQSETTTAAYVQELVSILTARMRERLPNHAVWLVIDDLEHHHISDASGREFLATLYDQIEQIPGLRVVLIGLDADASISGLNADNAVTSVISNEDVSNLEILFKTWFEQRTAHGPAVGPKAIDLLAKTMGSYAMQPAPLKAMADFVVNHVPSEILDGEGSE